MKQLFVLGAGASKTLDYPLADELLPDVLSHLGETRGPLIRFISYFYPLFRPNGDWFPLAEDVLGMMHVAQQYGTMRSKGRGYPWRGDAVEQAEHRFRRLLGRYLWSRSCVMPPEHCLRKLVRRFSTGTVYTTFNYDVSLETALNSEGIPYSYGLPLPSNGVTVLKPHGSINWYERAAVHRSRLASCVALGEGLLCWPNLDPESLTSTRSFDIPYLIPPTPSKEIDTLELGQTWRAFQSAIHTARSIFVVGYSLPAADRLARLVMLRGSRPVDSRSGRRMTVVNPDPSIEKVFRETVSSEITFHPMKLEEWSERWH